MTEELNKRRIRIYDFTQFAHPSREAIRDNAGRLADEHGVKIEFIRGCQVRHLQ